MASIGRCKIARYGRCLNHMMLRSPSMREIRGSNVSGTSMACMPSDIRHSQLKEKSSGIV